MEAMREKFLVLQCQAVCCKPGTWSVLEERPMLQPGLPNYLRRFCTASWHRNEELRQLTASGAR